MMIQKLKNILFKLSILALCLSYSLIYAAEKPTTRRLYALRVGRQTFEIKENQLQKLRLPSGSQNVLLQPLDRNEFTGAGISFQFPVHMDADFPNPNNELIMLDGNLISKNHINKYYIVITISRYKSVTETFFEDTISNAMKNFRQSGSRNVQKSVMRFRKSNNESVEGCIITQQPQQIQESGLFIVHEFYPLKKGNEMVFISLQDVRFDANTPSNQFMAMKKLFFSTLKIDGQKVVDAQAMFKNS